MKEDQIEFRSAGRVFAGRFFVPDAGRGTHPGVLVLHGGAGLGIHEIERARALAELGYVAFAPDIFGEVFASRERGIEVINGLLDDAQALRTRLADALAFLRAARSVDPARLAAIGFCFGGLAALELARSGADVRAVVSFHGGLTSRLPAEPAQVKASILVCTGSADPHVPREHRSALEDEMTRAQADWQLHVHAGAMHGFTERGGRERPGARYDERADRRSWSAMRALFDAAL